MPAKDIYHNTVKTALEKDDWIVTNDPLVIRWGKRDL
ncbi:element excision factor XisH family protein [Okeania sp. SIO2C2]